jgi:hypothetical protein
MADRGREPRNFLPGDEQYRFRIGDVTRRPSPSLPRSTARILVMDFFSGRAGSALRIRNFAGPQILRRALRHPHRQTVARMAIHTRRFRVRGTA